MLSIPFVGTWLAFLFFGGEFPSPELLPRLFILHVLLIPLLLMAMLGAHLAMVWHQTHTQYRAPGRTEDTVTGTPVWPKFALKGMGVAFLTWAILAFLGGLFQINPVWFYGGFVPYEAASPAQPDFYAGWLEGILRLSPNWEFHHPRTHDREPLPVRRWSCPASSSRCWRSGRSWRRASRRITPSTTSRSGPVRRPCAAAIGAAGITLVRRADARRAATTCSRSTSRSRSTR